jgi:hypothetical protein
MLEGANMQAAGYVSPDEKDFEHHENIRQSMLLRFAIAAVWFFIVGTAQVSAVGMTCTSSAYIDAFTLNLSI